MKKILYFLIGFLISIASVLIIDVTESRATCADAGGTFTPPSNYAAYYDVYINVGTFTDTTCLNSDGLNYAGAINAYCAANPPTPYGWSTFYSATFTQGGVNYSVSLKQSTKPNVKNTIVYAVIGTPCSGICGDDGGAGDSDGDGLPDSCDAYPDQDIDYNAQVEYYIKSKSTGAVVGMGIRTDLGDAYESGIRLNEISGSIDADPNYYAQMIFNPVMRPAAELCTEDKPYSLPGLNSPPEKIDDTEYKDKKDDYENKDGVRESDNKTDRDGRDSETGDSDNKLLEKIADNTSKGLSNDGVISDYLDAINKGIKGLGGKLGRGGGGAGVLGAPDTTQKDVDQTVGPIGGLDGLGSAITQANERMTAPNTLDDVGESEIGQFKEKFNMTEEFPAIIQDNPLEDVKDGITLHVSGSPSFSHTIFGKTITFDASPYESVLDGMGLFVFGLAGIRSFLIIMGRS